MEAFRSWVGRFYPELQADIVDSFRSAADVLFRMLSADYNSSAPFSVDYLVAFAAEYTARSSDAIISAFSAFGFAEKAESIILAEAEAMADAVMSATLKQVMETQTDLILEGNHAERT